MRGYRAIANALLAVAAIAAMGTGCAVQRGEDFGSYVGRPNEMALTQPYNVQKTPVPTNGEFALLLPPIGSIPDNMKDGFKNVLLREAEQALPCRINTVGPKDNLAEYVTEKNISIGTALYDVQEVTRVGKLYGATYVICVWVNRVRSHPPQDLELYFAVVDVANGRMAAEMDAHYNAAEQKVLLALDEYLQGSRAREYDKTNLEIMLRSPYEYQSFVAYECMHALAGYLWPKQDT